MDCDYLRRYESQFDYDWDNLSSCEFYKKYYEEDERNELEEFIHTSSSREIVEKFIELKIKMHAYEKVTSAITSWWHENILILEDMLSDARAARQNDAADVQQHLKNLLQAGDMCLRYDLVRSDIAAWYRQNHGKISHVLGDWQKCKDVKSNYPLEAYWDDIRCCLSR